MVSVKELAQKTMTSEKRASAKNDIFAFYIGRPITYVMTLPFLALNVKPNTVSFLSFFPSVAGFFLLGFGKTTALRVAGCLCFLLWSFLDGVDGNIARYTEQTSTLGTLWDAAAGYFAAMLMHFAVGISVMNIPLSRYDILPLEDYIYVVLAGLTSMVGLYSRLVMHKKMVLFTSEAGDKLRDKSQYFGLKLIAFNLNSASGFKQVILLVCVALGLPRYFVVAYFILHFAEWLYSMMTLLKE